MRDSVLYLNPFIQQIVKSIASGSFGDGYEDWVILETSKVGKWEIAQVPNFSLIFILQRVLLLDGSNKSCRITGSGFSLSGKFIKINKIQAVAHSVQAEFRLVKDAGGTGG